MEASVPMQSALDALKAGRAVIVPTDTVVGIGVAVDYAESPADIARLKERDATKPIAWLVAGSEDLHRYGADVPAYAFDLAQQNWPGALTLVVKASDAVPGPYVSPKGTIGLRMPASEHVLVLLRALGCPLATTSANKAGKAAVRSIDEMDATFAEDVMIYNTNEQGSGCASTVIDCTGDQPVVLRKGDSAVLQQ